MHIWLITVGEPLPMLSAGSRLWRTGLLAAELARRGHRVCWWTSRFDHFTKEFFAADSASVQAADGPTLLFLDGCRYRRNVSLARLVNHWQLGRGFRKSARRHRAPDLILCSFPTIELASEALRYGRQRGVTVVIDVRDLWPDTFLEVVPRPLRWLARVVLSPYFAAARRVFRRADALSAVSHGYLSWALRGARREVGAADRVVPLGYSFPRDLLPSRADSLEVMRSYGASPGRITCLFSGTFGRTYDLAPVFEVAAELQRAGGSFQFLICGDGERREEWHVRATGLRNVIFTGWLDQARMQAMLMASDIGLAAYSYAAPQGIPNKVVEYLAAGLPVVSSLQGECEDFLQETKCGITYRAADPQSLKSALLQLADEDVRQQHAARARSLFEDRFQAERVYRDFADHLEAVAQAKRPRE